MADILLGKNGLGHLSLRCVDRYLDGWVNFFFCVLPDNSSHIMGSKGDLNKV